MRAVRIIRAQEGYKTGWIKAAAVIFSAGIVLGAVYCMSVGENTDSKMMEYITGFLSGIGSEEKIFIFKNAALDNLRLFLIMFLLSFFKAGFFSTAAVTALKGAEWGFLASCFLKYYRFRGFIFMAVYCIKNIIFIPVLVIYAAICMSFSLGGGKRDKKDVEKYLLLSFCTLTIFCALSFYEGFIATIFMKAIAPFYAG